MRGRLSVVIVGALLLAGCTGTDEPVSGAGVENETLEAPLDPRIEAASAPPNETVAKEIGLAGEAHAHDGWGSATRLTLVDDDFGMAVDLSEDEGAFATFPVVSGFVLEGTATVEVVLSEPRRVVCSPVTVNGQGACTPPVADPSPPAGMTLLFRHASSGAEWIEAGPVGWGEPLIIAIDDVTWTDMPHSGLSLWSFQARSPERADSSVIFHARVDIARGPGEIPMWPGHPRFYDEAHEREVFFGQGQTTTQGIAEVAELGAWMDSSAVTASKLVSWGTKTLIVSYNITSTEAPPGSAPGSWQMAYSNATGFWTWAPDRVVATGGPIRFVVPIDEAGMDSPYAPGSRWRFVLNGDFYVGEESVFWFSLGGFVPYTVHYEVRVVASDLPPEAYSPEAGTS